MLKIARYPLPSKHSGLSPLHLLYCICSAYPPRSQKGSPLFPRFLSPPYGCWPHHASFFLTSTVPTFTTMFRNIKIDTGLMDVPLRSTCLGVLAAKTSTD